ncbi:hypothetical protein ANN_02800 [Periplaneta americana]|uniref:Uncharacterized protein n=1 Tax=Periplaneta americana TaxID=6978 RepID=A0ABQ8TZR5_PERAM|nr:hypothetical protein ANN_02800 [Periplaneta americana]
MKGLQAKYTGHLCRSRQNLGCLIGALQPRDWLADNASSENRNLEIGTLGNEEYRVPACYRTADLSLRNAYTDCRLNCRSSLKFVTLSEILMFIKDVISAEAGELRNISRNETRLVPYKRQPLDVMKHNQLQQHEALTVTASLVLAEDQKKERKTDKRGLHDLGYGFGDYGHGGGLSFGGHEHIGLGDHSLGGFEHLSLGGHSLGGHGESHVKAITITKEVKVPIPHPYPVHVEKKVPFPVKVPVPVHVDKPYPVPVPKPYPVYVEKKVPYPVDKPVPYPVKVPVKVPVPVPHPVHVPKPYPVKVPVPHPYPVKVPVVVEKKVPVFIKGHDGDFHGGLEGHGFEGHGFEGHIGFDFGGHH